MNFDNIDIFGERIEQRKVLLEMKNVSFAPEGKQVIRNVNLTIHEGESLVFVGHSGSGKSSMLKLCSGLYTPTEGSVFIDGVNINKLSRLKRLEIIRKIGFVFQDSGLVTNLNIYENVALILRYHKLFNEKKIKEIINEKLINYKLDHISHLIPSYLSPGQKRLVSFVRAVILENKILFLDDPTTSIDGYMIRKIIDHIKNLTQQGGVVITVTNNQEFSDAIAHHIAVMDQGSLIAFDEPEKIKSSSDPIVKQIMQSLNKDKELADEFLKIMESDIF